MRISEQVATEIETNDQSPSNQSNSSTKSEWHESQGSPSDSMKCEMGRRERERVFDSHTNNSIETSSSGEHDASESAPDGDQQHQTNVRGYSTSDRAEQHTGRSSTVHQSNNDHSPATIQ